MSTQQLLLRLIADGRIHSGRELAEQLGVSRTAVWKQLKGLQLLGVGCDAIPGKGYQIKQKIELLEREAILANLQPEAIDALEELDIFWEIPSTNDFLLNGPAAASGKARACIAERQSLGRGRRGRTWQSPLGSGLYLSLAWQFVEMPRDFAALGLVAGVCVTRALAAVGVANVMLKWPNDVLVDEGKLAGILVEVRGEPDGPMRAIIGIGINCHVSHAMRDVVTTEGGLRPVGISDLSTAGATSRNALAGVVLEQIIRGIAEFERAGFSSFAEEWQSRDALLGRDVDVRVGNAIVSGTVDGLADDGRLRVTTLSGVQYLAAGEVSLRSAL